MSVRCVRACLCAQNVYNIPRSYIAAPELEVILNFISAVIIRHLPLLSVGRQIGGQTFPLDGERTDKDGRRAMNVCLAHVYVLNKAKTLTFVHYNAHTGCTFKVVVVYTGRVRAITKHTLVHAQAHTQK